jgi:hypothetical protein
MKEWILISVQPTDLFFAWQLNIQLHNFSRLGISNRYHVLLYTSPKREIHPLFFALEKRYPEVKFIYFDDSKEGKCWHLIKTFNYIPLLRPWCLQEYFTVHPELSDKCVFYLDSDVIFTKYPDFIEGLLNDNINYLSDTRSYISASYFDSKIKDVIPRKIDTYKKRDILAESISSFGISREICEKNEFNTGGAQYLLKGIDAKFWADVLDGCMMLRVHLTNVNNQFFESEDKGFQVWCADMWSLLWNLWKRGQETSTPTCMDFAWATTPIKDWKNKYIYHDAGAIEGCFDKMLFRNNTTTPFDLGVDYNKINLNMCSSKYVEELLDSKQTFNNLKV